MKRIGASLGALAALACVLLAVALAAPRVLGLTPFVVLSGSMEPTYPVGSLVYVRSVDASELRVGDPVTFTLEGREAVATHRVIEVDAESASLRTQGDANDEPDGSPVQFASLRGCSWLRRRSPAFSSGPWSHRGPLDEKRGVRATWHKVQDMKRKMKG